MNETKNIKNVDEVVVSIRMLEEIYEFIDACWRGKYSDLPARLLGHQIIGHLDGVKQVVNLENSHRNDAYGFTNELDEILAKAKGTWE